MSQLEGAELSKKELEQIAGGKASDEGDDEIFVTSMVTNGISIAAVAAGAASM